MLFSLLFSSFLNSAQAVPLQLTQQGRILDSSGSGVSGLHDLTFRVYDSDSSGTLLWWETITVNFINGYYSSVLGADEQNNPLDSDTLSQYPIWLELQLDSNAPMTNRQAINSAPYAQISGTAESVDGGSVNASEIRINTMQVIDGSGNWVGQPITVNWSNIDPNTIPSYLADGDDNTQLSEPTVEGYITNDALTLAAGSEIGLNGEILGEDSTLDWGNIDASTLPTGIADGDDDSLAGISCQAGEILGWTGSWTCVSDNTLDATDLGTLLSNNAVDLHVATTIGGADILTTLDDSDTLANLSCGNDGEIARYDLALEEWYCDADIDTDTQLSPTQVVGYVDGQQLNLGAGSLVDGSPILTEASSIDWSSLDSSTIPSGLADGDNDTLGSLVCSNNGEVPQYDTSTAQWSCATVSSGSSSLSEGQVETYITNGSLTFAAGSQIGTDGQILGANSTLDWTNIDTSTIPSGLADGDDNTQLSQSQVLSNVSGQQINLGAGSQVDSQNILTSASSIGWSSLDSSTIPTGLADGDDNTQLSQTQVVNHVTGQQINLGAGSQVDSQNILTSASSIGWSSLDSSTIPTGLADGDDNTQLSQTQVVNHVDGQQVNLGGGSTVDNLDIVADPGGCLNGDILLYDLASATWACGQDTDTTLSASEVQAMVQAVSGIALQAGATVDGSPILTEASTLSPTNIDTSGAEEGQMLMYGDNDVGYSDLHWANGCVLQDSDGAGKTILSCGGHTVLIENSTYVWREIALGADHSCGIDSNYQVHCWGDDSYNQVTDTPSDLFTHIASGTNHLCGIDIYDAVQCWGASADNQTTVPLAFTTATNLAAGDDYTCAETDVGIVCWGTNHSTYSAGNVSYDIIPTLGSVVAGSMVSGDSHVCVDTNLGVECWGDNSSGQLTVPSSLGSIMPGSLAAGPNHTCAIDASNGDVECWGDNASGQSTVPNFSAYPTNLALSGDSTCARVQGGDVECWGGISFGLLLTFAEGSFENVYGGGAHFCSTALSGATIECWGDDTYNQDTPATP